MRKGASLVFIVLQKEMKQKNSQLDALVDSKKEYMDHLYDLLSEPMIATFQDLYQQCLASPETRKKGILNSFQDALASIAAWNQHLISEYYGQIVSHTGCKYIPDLIRALISVQVKINLMANSNGLTMNNIKLRVPNAENFVHRCYVDVARAVWKRPYLLYHNVRAVERQQNLLDLEKIIQQSIRTTLRGYIPMEQLIAQIQTEPERVSSESETESDSDTESEETETESYESESDTESSAVASIVEVVELPSPIKDIEEPPLPDPVEYEEPTVEEQEEQPIVVEVDREGETVDAQEEVAAETNDDVVDPQEEETAVVKQAQEEEPNVDEVEVVVVEEPKDEEEIRPYRKSVEYSLEPTETVRELLVNKVEEPESPVAAPPLPIQEMQASTERAAPFHMMLMNRKIINYKPMTSIMAKKREKKREDAFF